MLLINLVLLNNDQHNVTNKSSTFLIVLVFVSEKKSLFNCKLLNHVWSSAFSHSFGKINPTQGFLFKSMLNLMLCVFKLRFLFYVLKDNLLYVKYRIYVTCYLKLFTFKTKNTTISSKWFKCFMLLVLKCATKASNVFYK